MGQTRRIALLLDRGLSFVRGVIQGVRVYAADKPNRVLRDGPPRLNLVSHVREWEPHALVYGHTHEATVERWGETLFVNPGYAGPPEPARERSVATLELATLRACIHWLQD